MGGIQIDIVPLGGYGIESISMDLDWIILDLDSTVIDANTSNEKPGIEVRESYIDIDYEIAMEGSSITDPLSIIIYHKDVVKKHSCLINVDTKLISLSTTFTSCCCPLAIANIHSGSLPRA